MGSPASTSNAVAPAAYTVERRLSTVEGQAACWIEDEVPRADE
jgi:hypothetical protein